MRVAEVPAPVPGPGEVRIGVASAGVNRADLLQRRGLYPPPAGASETMGLECAGTIIEVGPDVTDWHVGDRVMALLAGGGYASEAVAPAVCLLPVPESLPLDQAGAFPETFLTVFLNVFMTAGLAPGGTALVHGGGSGIGTAAIALVRASGARIAVTAGSDEKCRRCLELGADRAVNYRSEDFVTAVAELTGGTGADVVLDHIGGPYLARNLDALATGGRLVVIATMGGAEAPLDLRVLMRKRLSVIGSTLRARPTSEKAEIVRRFADAFGAALGRGELRPVVDAAFPLERAADAHRLMAASGHFGKIVLRLDGPDGSAATAS